MIALIIFGPFKLPEIGRAFGRTLTEFKSASKGLMNGEEDTEDKNNKPELVSVEKEKDKHAVLK